MPTLTELLSVSKLTEIAPAIEDVRTLPGKFRGLQRLPFVPAEDADIMARVSGRETAGDVLPDGGVPLVKTAAPITLDQVSIANFKREVNVPATQLALLARIIRSGGADDLALTSFGGYLGDVVKRNRMGNMQRMEQACWGMFLDSFTYAYDGQMFTINWGKPADLKPVVSTPWSNVAATPITDSLTLLALAGDKYSVIYDRAELRLADFLNAIRTNEFQTLAKGVAGPNYTSPAANTARNREIFAALLGLDEVTVFEDSLDEENMDASIATTKFLPPSKVLFSRKSDDGNSSTWMFGNGLVLESMVAEALGDAASVIGGAAETQRGPFTFASAPRSLTSLSITEVVRGLPNSKNPASTAVLTVA